MSDRVYRAVGIGLVFVVAIVALISFTMRNESESWWLPVAIAGVVSGGWWAIAAMFVNHDCS